MSASENESILELLRDVIAPLGSFKAQRMFSGHGLYLDGLFFALLIGGVLYFKTSAATQDLYKAEGMQPFGYDTKNGRRVLTSHWRVPERLLDEPDEMRDWARAALAAARAKKQTAARAASRTKADKKKPRTKGARSS